MKVSTHTVRQMLLKKFGPNHVEGANNGDLRGRGAKCFWVFHCGLIEFNLEVRVACHTFIQSMRIRKE